MRQLCGSEYQPGHIFVQFYSDPEYNFKVPRANFFPQPNVVAAAVAFKLKHPSEYPSVPSIKSFFSLVFSFSNRAKLSSLIAKFELQTLSSLIIMLILVNKMAVIGSQMNSAFNRKRKMLRKTLQHIRTSSEIEASISECWSSCHCKL